MKFMEVEQNRDLTLGNGSLQYRVYILTSYKSCLINSYVVVSR